MRFLFLEDMAQIFGNFPEDFGVVLHEMVVEGGLAVDWPLELELLDDSAGLEVELLLDDEGELVVVVAWSRGAVGVHVDGDRVGNADTVGHLDQAAVAQLVVHQGFGNPSGGIGA